MLFFGLNGRYFTNSSSSENITDEVEGDVQT